MAGKYAGRSGGRWRQLAAAQRAKRLPCWLCGQPIDYTLAPPDPGAYSTDHERPRSTHPELAEDPSNLRSAHYGCNSGRGNRAPAADIGTTSQDW